MAKNEINAGVSTGVNEVVKKWEELFTHVVSAAHEVAQQAAQNPVVEKVRERVKEKVGENLEMAAFLGQNYASLKGLGQLIDSAPASIGRDLGKKVLDRASEWADPFQIGMGLKVLQLGDQSAEAEMPHHLRNRSQTGALHAGALTALAEFVSRIYWERHLGAGQAVLSPVGIEIKLIRPAHSVVKAQASASGEEREGVLFALRSQGHASFGSVVNVFDRKGHLVAQATVEWKAQLSPRLSAATGGASAT